MESDALFLSAIRMFPNTCCRLADHWKTRALSPMNLTVPITTVRPTNDKTRAGRAASSLIRRDWTEMGRFGFIFVRAERR
jgi:hypothetical protein